MDDTNPTPEPNPGQVPEPIIPNAGIPEHSAATAMVAEMAPNLSEKDKNWFAEQIKQGMMEAIKALSLDMSGNRGAPPLGGLTTGAGGGAGDPPRMLTGTPPPNPYRPDTPDNDFIHGVKGKIKFGVLDPDDGTYTYTEFFVESVSVDESVDTDDITNTSSLGDQVILDGIRKINGSLSFVWDSLNIFFIAPLPWKTRNYVLLSILPDGVTEGYKFCALITGHSTGTGPKQGTVRITCNYMSTGPITHATASQTTATGPLTS